MLDQCSHSEDTAHPYQPISISVDGQEEKDSPTYYEKEIDDICLFHEEDLSAYCDQSEEQFHHKQPNEDSIEGFGQRSVEVHQQDGIYEGKDHKSRDDHLKPYCSFCLFEV